MRTQNLILSISQISTKLLQLQISLQRTVYVLLLLLYEIWSWTLAVFISCKL